MSKRRDQHHADRAALAELGKPLSRRARSRCELCGATTDEAGKLHVRALPGGPAAPDEDWALLLCDRCGELEAQPTASLRFLAQAMWSEVVPARVAAVRALRRTDADWAREALEQLWVDDDLQARIDASSELP